MSVTEGDSPKKMKTSVFVRRDREPTRGIKQKEGFPCVGRTEQSRGWGILTPVYSTGSVVSVPL